MYTIKGKKEKSVPVSDKMNFRRYEASDMMAGSVSSNTRGTRKLRERSTDHIAARWRVSLRAPLCVAGQSLGEWRRGVRALGCLLFGRTQPGGKRAAKRGKLVLSQNAY